MEDIRTHAGERSWWTQLSLRSPQPPPRITFADLARVHHAWRAPPDDAALSSTTARRWLRSNTTTARSTTRTGASTARAAPR